MKMPSNCIIILTFFFYLSTVNLTLSKTRQQQEGPGKHFVLVHGSCHGAWSWYKLVPLLKSSGHNVTALDLAASGIDLRQPKDLRSISDYHRPLMEFMESLQSNERVILVGHSLGGLAISQAMEKFPDKVCVAVFVAALMPGPALNISTLNQQSFSRQGPLLDSKFSYDNGSNKPPTTFIFGPLYLSSNVYQHSPVQDRELATMLMRPLPLFSDEDMSRELVLTDEKYGSVDRVFIIAKEDKVQDEDLLWWMAERNPPNSVQVINGSDHMVMMSKPRELSSILVTILLTIDQA